MSKFEDTRFYRYGAKWIGTVGLPLTILGFIVLWVIGKGLFVEFVRWVATLWSS